ncbi:MAG: YidH family protein [Kofleriaceae bacterium]
MRTAAPAPKLPADTGNHFAWLRTRLALERTMMAWIRTGAAMIGFGFTIVEFFSKFSQMAGVAPAHYPRAPRDLGMALIAVGVVAQVAALWQYRAFLRYLRGEQFAAIAGTGHPQRFNPLVPLAFALLAIGVFAFAAIVARDF